MKNVINFLEFFSSLLIGERQTLLFSLKTQSTVLATAGYEKDAQYLLELAICSPSSLLDGLLLRMPLVCSLLAFSSMAFSLI